MRTLSEMIREADCVGGQAMVKEIGAMYFGLIAAAMDTGTAFGEAEAEARRKTQNWGFSWDN